VKFNLVLYLKNYYDLQKSKIQLQQLQKEENKSEGSKESEGNEGSEEIYNGKMNFIVSLI
jgi:hypothetical protein